MDSKGVVLSIQVVPHSGKFGVAGWDEWKKSLKIRVKAKAQKNLANREVEEKLGGMLATEVKVLKGLKSGKKEILVKGFTLAELKEKIQFNAAK